MANSKLLKEAIADAKAVRETAIANAKIALEEAFTPRLQSILSQKLQQEMEDEEEADVNEEYSDGSEAPTEDASDIGDGDNKQPSDSANDSSDLAKGNPDTDVETSEVGSEDDNTEKANVSESEEGDDEESIEEGEYNADGEEEVVAEEEDEDELDLESIIKELEDELAQEEEDFEEELDSEEESEVEDIADDAVESHEDDMHEEEGEESFDDSDEEIDLDEILREMGYDDDEEEKVEESEEDDSAMAEKEAELEEAYNVIKSLKKTINEVNLLNAKLLYTNKLFRSYDLTNEQKHKVVETLDRTGNVREVKLVFSTLAESFKFNGTTKKQKASKINESFASKPVASTAPKKAVITESTNAMADRFKKLANIR